MVLLAYIESGPLSHVRADVLLIPLTNKISVKGKRGQFIYLVTKIDLVLNLPGSF